jgi:hypothetical protein
MLQNFLLASQLFEYLTLIFDSNKDVDMDRDRDLDMQTNYGSGEEAEQEKTPKSFTEHPKEK